MRWWFLVAAHCLPASPPNAHRRYVLPSLTARAQHERTLPCDAEPPWPQSQIAHEILQLTLDKADA
jgi:hypothetical protein